MKKIVLSLCILSCSTCLFGQTKDGAVKISPLLLIFGTFDVAYEKVLSDKTSGQIELTFVSLNSNSSEGSGFGVTPAYRFYHKEALDGFNLSPILTLAKFKTESAQSNTEDAAKISMVGPGLRVGWNWLLGKNEGFVIDLGVKAQYYSSRIKITSGASGALNLEPFEGFETLLDFSVGFSF